MIRALGIIALFALAIGATFYAFHGFVAVHLSRARGIAAWPKQLIKYRKKASKAYRKGDTAKGQIYSDVADLLEDKISTFNDQRQQREIP